MRSVWTMLALSMLTFQSIAQEGKIYFASAFGGNDRQLRIGEINLDGTGYRQITSHDSYRSDYQSHVSADGKHMTFNTYLYGGWKIAIADSDGKNMRKLTKDNAYEYDASWSADGKKVILIGFQRGNSGKRQLFLVDPSTGVKQQITDQSYSHYSPKFIGNDKLLFAATEEGQFDIYTLDLNTKEKVNLTDTKGIHEFSPALSPDGKLLAHHQVNNKDEVSLYILNLETGVKHQVYTGWESQEKLPESESPLFCYSISWSPTGDRLVFTSYLGNRNFEIMVIGKDGKNLRRLTNSPTSDIQPHWVRVTKD